MNLKKIHTALSLISGSALVGIMVFAAHPHFSFPQKPVSQVAAVAASQTIEVATSTTAATTTVTFTPSHPTAATTTEASFTPVTQEETDDATLTSQSENTEASAPVASTSEATTTDDADSSVRASLTW